VKVLLLSDIHANRPAMDAVLARGAKHGCEAVWNLGDCLGYGPHPEDVVETLRTRSEITSVIGNYDRKVLKFARKPSAWPHPKSPAKFFAFHWAHEQLTEDQRAFLDHLPEQQRLDVDGHTVLLTHASPEGAEEPVGPETPPHRLAELADQARADLVVFGHTHQQFDRTVENVRFINPGSVGRPDDGDPRAAYAVLDLQPGQVDVQFYRAEYDTDAAAEDVRRRGLPEAFAQMLLKGRNLNHIVAEMTRQPDFIRSLMTSDDARFQAVLHLAETCHYEARHAQQVTYLALRLFDELQTLHALGNDARFTLGCAGLLHDIGWIEGQSKHHKVSRDLILDARHLPFDDRERRLIANIVRYHRKALPSMDHELYASQQSGDRNTVDVLAGLLRLADGLDRSHDGLVKDLTCRVDKSTLHITLHVVRDAEEELAAGRKKADLLERTFQRAVTLSARDITAPNGNPTNADNDT
jgi:putative phosphoesterase